MRHFVVVIAIFLLASCSLLPTSAPPVEGTQAGPARWRALPPDVCAVFIGPDQRVWQISTPPGRSTAANLAAVKKEIAEEFAKQTPTLSRSWPVLFDDTYAWFVTHDSRTLIGYDGKNFIERNTKAPADVVGFVGSCPGRGRNSYSAGPNLYAGGTRYFIETAGVSSFDGKQWNFHAFDKPYHDQVTLYAEKDGHSVLMLTPRNPALWRCRAGAWTQLQLPEKVKNSAIMGNALAPDGTLWLNVGGGIHSLSLSGPPTLTPVKVDRFDLSFGNPTLGQDENGTIFISFWTSPEIVADRKVTLILSHGQTRMISGVELRHDNFVGMLPYAWKNDVWVGSTISSGDRYMTRLNLADALPQLVDVSPKVYRYIHGVAADGTAYLGMDNPLDPYFKDAVVPSVVAYLPSAPDNRAVIRPKILPVGGWDVTVAPDGAIWSPINNRGVCRLESGQWVTKTMPIATAGGTIIHGRGNAMFRWRGYGTEMFAFINGDTLEESPDLRELIRSNRKAVLANFGGALPASTWWSTQGRAFPGPPRKEGGWSIAVDKNDRIYLAIGHTLQVLGSDEKWIDIPWPGPAPVQDPQISVPVLGNGPTLVLAIGDGSAIYVVDYKSHEPPPRSAHPADRAYILMLDRNNEPTWTLAPAPAEGLFRDAADNLWVVSREKKPDLYPSPLDPIFAQKIAPAGLGKKFSLPATPALVEANDTFWLSTVNNNRQHSGVFHLWREGSIVGEVRVPGVWMGQTICSDKPGSVWVWTTLGLHHVVAENLAEMGRYNVKNVGYIESSQVEIYQRFGSSNYFGASDHGVYFITTFNDPRASVTQFELNLVPAGSR